MKMSRREQVEKILHCLNDKFGITLMIDSNGKVTFEHYDMVPDMLEEAKVILTCNFRDIVRFISDENSLKNTKAYDKPSRKENGCDEICPLTSDSYCQCDTSCFPDINNACQWCDLNTIQRVCKIVNPLSSNGHDGIIPDESMVVENFKLHNKEQLTILDSILKRFNQDDDPRPKEETKSKHPVSRFLLDNKPRLLPKSKPKEEKTPQKEVRSPNKKPLASKKNLKTQEIKKPRRGVL